MKILVMNSITFKSYDVNGKARIEYEDIATKHKINVMNVYYFLKN